MPEESMVKPILNTSARQGSTVGGYSPLLIAFSSSSSGAVLEKNYLGRPEHSFFTLFFGNCSAIQARK